jgi:hypothetical protein
VATLLDDLGHPLSLARPPQRIVSLVPSLTEALAVTVPDRLAGVTDWCSHPPGLDRPRVRGTKNPDRAAIIALSPDLVVANREENRRHDVERLRAAGIAVWVTEIETVDAALRSLRRLFTDVLSVPEPGWLRSAASQWSGPPPLPPLRTIVPIWRDPWMAVGSRTFAGDLLTRLGLAHVFVGSPDRYPRLGLTDLTAAGADLVVLPDEPYRFTATDGPEAFPGSTVALVPGRSLTWYGPSLASARTELAARITAATGGLLLPHPLHRARILLSLRKAPILVVIRSETSIACTSGNCGHIRTASLPVAGTAPESARNRLGIGSESVGSGPERSPYRAAPTFSPGSASFPPVSDTQIGMKRTSTREYG